MRTSKLTRGGEGWKEGVEAGPSQVTNRWHDQRRRCSRGSNAQMAVHLARVEKVLAHRAFLQIAAIGRVFRIDGGRHALPWCDAQGCARRCAPLR